MTDVKLLSVSNGKNRSHNELLENYCGRNCMCKNRVVFKPNNSLYSKVDVNDRATVGPVLTLSFSCGCSSKYILREDEMLNKSKKENNSEGSMKKRCPPGLCLNGGRCLPKEERFK